MGISFTTKRLAGRVVLTLAAGAFFANSILIGRAEADVPAQDQALPTDGFTTDAVLPGVIPGFVTENTAPENAVSEDVSVEEAVVGEIRTDEISTDEIPFYEISIDEISINEIPEEILRTEIITEARSPLTGEPLSAAEYAQLTDELRSPAGTPLVNPQIRYIIYLLQIRRAIKPIVPFL